MRQREIELLTHQTEKNPNTKYNFDEDFYKFPSYLRRAAINEAIGKVSSYKSNLANWQEKPEGKEAGMPRLWARAKGLNQNVANLTAQFIIDVAKSYSANVIVFEHLYLSGKKRGTKKQRLHLWKARAIQQIVEHKAHQEGMRISRICTWNTSRLAYDGSGYVQRDKHNYSICTFQNGKKYHCDLSASYNIGARYFIRELLKSLSATLRQKSLSVLIIAMYTVFLSYTSIQNSKLKV